MKPIGGTSVAVDEMFPEGTERFYQNQLDGAIMDDDSAGFPLMDTNREGIHADFKKDFIDIFDDEDLA